MKGDEARNVAELADISEWHEPDDVKVTARSRSRSRARSRSPAVAGTGSSKTFPPLPPPGLVPSQSSAVYVSHDEIRVMIESTERAALAARHAERLSRSAARTFEQEAETLEMVITQLKADIVNGFAL